MIAVAALGACLMAAAPLAAQAPAPSLTVYEAIAQAIARSRPVKVAALDVAKAGDDLAALKAQRRPYFGVKALAGSLAAPMDFTFKQGVFGVFPQIGPIPGVDTKIRTNPGFVTLLSAQVAQPLTQLRKISIGEQALSVGRRIAEEKVRLAEQAAANNVKRLYYGIVEAESGIRANANALALYHEVDRLMGNYSGQEAVLQGDVLQARTALARQEQADLSLHNTIATLKEQMNILLGRDISTDFSVSDSLGGAEPDIDIASAQTQALAERPEMRDARLKAQQAEADLRLAKEQRVPEISLTFNYLGFYNFQVLPTHAAAFGVTGSWEPWDWGRRKAEADAKARVVEQANLGVLETESLVKADVSAQSRRMQEARGALKVADLARQTAAEKLRVALDQFKQEATLRRQVLEAQAEDAEARLQFQQALAAYWTARADFEKALGGR